VPINARRAAVTLLAAAAVGGGVAPASLRAQGGLLVQGIADAELWSSDTLSNLLTRNAGTPGAVARLQLWAAVEPWRRFVVYAQGEAIAGPARSPTERYGASLNQLGIRYTRSPAFVMDAGKMTHVVGVFASRRFSDRNPLIGVPDAYPVQYPVGAKVSGATTHFDYRVAALSLPASHENYVPNPDAAMRPAAGFGVTPFVGFRLGTSATVGPYLNQSFTTTQLNGQDWKHYHQRIAAVDAAFSRGYLETYAELALSSYDVPRRAEPISGTAYYVEAKYTLQPWLFVAGRFERNDYPFISSFGPTVWVARPTKFNNGELGAGLRLTATTLVKASYRVDRWTVTPENRAFVRPGGNAFALQISQSYDVMDWVDRLRMR
jgi:hypothetical protein